eukprot:3380795-Pyramimonas_sp.AAC.1
MIAKIFGVGTPASNVPFLWSLAVDAAQAKDIVLGSGVFFQHLPQKFWPRRRPAATRLFHALSAREDEVMEVTRQCSGQQKWNIACSIFDEPISTCAPGFRANEIFGDLQEDCGVKLK